MSARPELYFGRQPERDKNAPTILPENGVRGVQTGFNRGYQR